MREIIVELNGVFDLRAVRRIEEALDLAVRGTTVRMDFAQVTEFEDFSVARLARALEPSKARIVVSGLRQHQERLLRYLGVDLARPRAAQAT